MAFFKEKYDAIVIGGALAGMSCALTLASKGKSVLVLERHNLPGGLTTSFVRGGLEMEATLHEMMSIGSKEKPLKIRKFLEEVDGITVERYSPTSGSDVSIIAAYYAQHFKSGKSKEKDE